MIKWLQDWYSSNCDREWEHENGIKIQTLDNPGWLLEIEILNISSIIPLKEYELFEVSEQNWIGYDVTEHKFAACGDSTKLEAMIKIFKVLIEGGEVDKEYIQAYLLS